MSMPFSLYLITNCSHSFSEYKKTISQALIGGVTAVQLRAKTSSYAEILSMAIELKALLAPFKVPLIINDYLDIAVEANADGLHLGQSDDSPQKARKMLGDKKLIGLSIESFADLEHANRLSCINYIAASAVFESATKTNIKTRWGLDGLSQIIQRSQHPVIAIGGITLNNVHSVLKKGPFGIAVSSVINSASNPQKTAAQFINIINNMRVIKES